MFTNDPAIIAAIWGVGGILLGLLVDYALKHSDREERVRNELRAEIARHIADKKDVADERDTEVRRRKEAELEVRRIGKTVLKLREQVAALTDERDAAETGSRLARTAADKALEDRAKCWESASQYEFTIAQLRADNECLTKQVRDLTRERRLPAKQ